MKVNKRTILIFFLIIAIGSYLLLKGPLTGASSLKRVGYVVLYTALLSFLYSLLSRDYSWTDRLWSTLPVLMAWIYAYDSQFSRPSFVAALMITVWGSRLTFNFARRGGYSGKEDYRWSILEKRINNPSLWLLFNILFIACYQQFLFIAFTSPLSVLTGLGNQSFTPLSFIALFLFFLFLLIETIADQEQYVFQQAKYNLLPKKESLNAEYVQGFKTSGLFALSRHPNYFGEIGVWWSLYLYCVSFNSTLFHTSIIGPLLLTLLFTGSTIFTESITASKYPLYKKYQKEVPAILFRFWKNRGSLNIE
jgi:steroid 5-alpha reductase family enzyme